MYTGSLINTTLRSRYYVKDKLGEGGIGETYLAIDQDQPGNYLCVIKRLKPQNVNQSTMRWLQQSFIKEATTLQRLGNHDQIPRLLAFFEENSEFFLIQELIDGNNLRAELSLGKQWNENQVIFLLRDVLEVLQIVHQQGVIHRDLKPENIMRRKTDGKIVLIDFGAVKEVSTQVFNTQGKIVSTTYIIGTPGYMPVEQLRQNPMLSSDIYAVGMIALEALTGLYPTEFVDSYTGQVVWQDRVRVRSDLRNFLNKMVAYHPDERYNSASEALYLIKELTQTVYNKPVSSPLPPPPIQLPTPPVQPISAIKYAGFGRRIAADFIDRSILIVGSLAWDFANFGLPNSENEGEFWGRIIVFYIILAFVYCPTMESFKTQATLGKIALGIIVTDLHGNRLYWGQAIKRHMSKTLSYLTLLVGFFMIGFTSKRQTLHDIVSGCLVIRKD